mgnify:CR=1 FL=1
MEALRGFEQRGKSEQRSVTIMIWKTFARYSKVLSFVKHNGWLLLLIQSACRAFTSFANAAPEKHYSITDLALG